MTEKQSKRFRSLIMFVIFWLFGAYIFELLVSVTGGVVGVLSALAAWGIHTVARLQAAKQVKTTWMFYFWLTVPMVLLFALPLVIKAVALWQSEKPWKWTDYVESLGPFVYQFIVPAAVLLYVYVRLGMMIPFAPDEPLREVAGDVDADAE